MRFRTRTSAAFLAAAGLSIGLSIGLAPAAAAPRKATIRVPVTDPDALVASDPDPDRDGVARGIDRCPDDPEDPDGFQDEDGCPDPDNDGDGVPDAADRCPTRAEVVNGIADDDGCPDEGAPQVAVARGAIAVGQRIFFDVGSDGIQAASLDLLRQVAAVLKARPDVARVRVEGHTDDVGDRERNVDLSQRRALSVVRFLVSEGIDARRLEARGFGPKVPLDPARTEEARARNRRVEFTILPAGAGGGGP
jgi:OmpA-OmpF porin, OOP family